MYKKLLSDETIFLRAFGAVLLLSLAEFLWEYYACFAAGRCLLLSDFPVAYQPAVALVQGNVEAVYDVGAIERWMAGAKELLFHPTLYPPFSLFLLYPLGFLPPFAAASVWFPAHILLLVVALRLPQIRALWADISWPYMGILLISFAVQTLLAGQLGILCFALFLMVLGLRRTHPRLAGIAFSALCLKPQMAFALLLLLVREKNWQCILTIVLCITACSLLSAELWGMALWYDYIKTSFLSALILDVSLPKYMKNMSSVYMAVRMVGGSSEMAQIVQISVTCIVLATLWYALKRCADDKQRVLLLAPATFLLSPYSYIYDTPLLVAACIVLAVQIREGRGGAAARIMLVLLAFIPLFAIRLQGLLHFPYAVLAIGLAYLYAWRNVYSYTN